MLSVSILSPLVGGNEGSVHIVQRIYLMVTKNVRLCVKECNK